MSNYHFIGIGGIGMSGLAKIILKKHKKNNSDASVSISGSDTSLSSILEDLQNLGAKIYLHHNEHNVSKNSKVIYSSAINDNNPEMQQALLLKLKILHRAELLYDLAKDHISLLVTGTHGKTTTSALLTHVLKTAKLHPSYMVGGILNNYNSNSDFGEGKHFVIEADESDGSFLKAANISGCIITNIEWDHVDFFKSEQDLINAFEKFILKVDKNHYVWCFEDKNLKMLNSNKIGISYGFSKNANIYAFNIRKNNFITTFDLNYKGKIIKNVELNLSGDHNILNALGVIALCLSFEIDVVDIKKACKTFLGIKRRMHLKKEHNSVLFFDDYAHHPTEIKALLQSLRESVLEKRIVALFQPHRYSRLKAFFKDFAKAFKEVDKLYVLDIYAASEKAIENINSKMLVDEIKKNNVDVTYLQKNEIPQITDSLRPHDVFISIGAGDVTKIGDDIINQFSKSNKKLKVGLVYGGRSSEHEISCISAKNIYNNLDKKIYDIDLFYITKTGMWMEGDVNFLSNSRSFKSRPVDILPVNILEKLKKLDIAFIALHGPNGEDGKVSSFFEILQIPFTGCDSYSASLCMNKHQLKDIAITNNIKTARHIALNILDNRKDLSINLKYPLYVKPSHLGSSVGVKKVINEKQLNQAIEDGFLLDTDLIIEEEVLGRQIEFAVLGQRFVEVAVAGEIISNNQPYSYEKKYGNNPMRTEVPAKLSKEFLEKGQNLAKKIYKLFGCTGFARVDLFLDENNNFLLNEINPIPGFTAISLFPKMWNFSNLTTKMLLDRIIICGLYKNRLQNTFFS